MMQAAGVNEAGETPAGNAAEVRPQPAPATTGEKLFGAIPLLGLYLLVGSYSFLASNLDLLLEPAGSLPARTQYFAAIFGALAHYWPLTVAGMGLSLLVFLRWITPYRDRLWNTALVLTATDVCLIALAGLALYRPLPY